MSETTLLERAYRNQWFSKRFDEQNLKYEDIQHSFKLYENSGCVYFISYEQAQQFLKSVKIDNVVFEQNKVFGFVLNFKHTIERFY